MEILRGMGEMGSGCSVIGDTVGVVGHKVLFYLRKNKNGGEVGSD